MFISEWERPTWPPSIQMGVTAGIFLASVLLQEMRYLVYIRYLVDGREVIDYNYFSVVCEKNASS